MFKHLLTAVALGSAVFLLTPASVASATWTLIDDFSDGNDDGWWRTDVLPGPPVGPGIFDASSGAYHLQNGGSRPIAIDAHWMGSGWTDSLVDPQFTHGFLRAKVKADTAGSLPWMWMRWSEELDGDYLFLANSVKHRFQIERLGTPYLVFPLDDPAIQFNLGEEWNIEGGTVGDQITLKVWQVGAPEPTTPQLTVIDSKYNQGSHFGVGGNVHGEALPSFLDVTFDDMYFMPSVLGDFNYSSDLDAGDIDLLSSEVHKVTPSKWFDLNFDQQVDRTDHELWVHDLQNTWYGDADLNGEFNSNDFVQVFQEGKYETALRAGWAEGDWDASGTFESSDFVVAFQDGGYEQGPRTDVAVVPEPGGWMLLVLGLGLWWFSRRSWQSI